jgi:hypothetical protein
VAGSEVTAERRGQVYTPDYLLNGRPRPQLTHAPGAIGYGAAFMLSFAGVPTLDRCAVYSAYSCCRLLHCEEACQLAMPC